MDQFNSNVRQLPNGIQFYPHNFSAEHLRTKSSVVKFSHYPLHHHACVPSIRPAEPCTGPFQLRSDSGRSGAGPPRISSASPAYRSVGVAAREDSVCPPPPPPPFALFITRLVAGTRCSCIAKCVSLAFCGLACFVLVSRACWRKT